MYCRKMKFLAFSFHVSTIETWAKYKSISFILWENSWIENRKRNQKLFTKKSRENFNYFIPCDWCLIFDVEVVRKKVFRLERKSFFIFLHNIQIPSKFSWKENFFTRAQQQKQIYVENCENYVVEGRKGV